MSFRSSKGQLGKALAALLGIKGGLDTPVGEEWAPAITLGDIWRTPHSPTWPRRGARRTASTALAGEFSYVGVRAGAASILRVTGILFSTAVAQGLYVGTLGTAGIGTISFGGTQRIPNISESPPGNTNNYLDSSVLQSGTDAALQFLEELLFIRLAANTSLYVPVAWDLWGDSQVPAICVVPSAVNLGVEASFLVEEWPLIP